MKSKISILAICCVSLVILAAVYTAGWVTGQSEQEHSLVKDAYAAGDTGKNMGGRASQTDPTGLDQVQ